MAIYESLQRRWFRMSVAAVPALLMPAPMDSADQGMEEELAKQLQNPVAALEQKGPWLINHIRSYAGDDDRADISAMFLQPFLSYTTPTA